MSRFPLRRRAMVLKAPIATSPISMMTQAWGKEGDLRLEQHGNRPPPWALDGVPHLGALHHGGEVDAPARQVPPRAGGRPRRPEGVEGGLEVERHPRGEEAVGASAGGASATRISRTRSRVYPLARHLVTAVVDVPAGEVGTGDLSATLMLLPCAAPRIRPGPAVRPRTPVNAPAPRCR